MTSFLWFQNSIDPVVLLNKCQLFLINTEDVPRYGYSSCPAFSQFDWLIIVQDGAILPDRLNCLTKLEMHVDQNCLKILGKLRKIMELGKMLLIKLMNDYFSGNIWWVFGKFVNQQKTLRKWFWTISWEIIFWKIVGKSSVNVRDRFVFAI